MTTLIATPRGAASAKERKLSQDRCGFSGASLSMSAIRLSSGSERAFIFRIKIGAMHLHRRFGDADIAGNLFVEATGRDLDHDLALAGAERVETLPERTQGLITLPTGTIASEAGLDSIEEVLITERLCEELYGTALHRLHGHRDVAVRCDEDDRDLPVRRGKVALKLKTASPRHSNVEHQASRAVRQGRP